MNKETNNDDLNFLDEASGAGFEGLRSSDLSVPFLRVLQPNSPEVVEGDPAYIPGAKAGVFVNSFTKEIYGSSIELVPIKSEGIWLEYTPKVGDKRGEFKGRHAVGSVPVTGDPFEGMFREDNGNEIRETMVFYCLVKGQEQGLPVVFSLTSSMIKHGKALNSLIYSLRLPSGKQAPYFGGYWKLALSLNQNDDGRWYNIGLRNVNAEFTGFVNKETFEIAVATRKMLDAGSVKTDFAQIGNEPAKAAITDGSDVKDY